jgi:hypothetical protein
VINSFRDPVRFVAPGAWVAIVLGLLLAAGAIFALVSSTPGEGPDWFSIAVLADSLALVSLGCGVLKRNDTARRFLVVALFLVAFTASLWLTFGAVMLLQAVRPVDWSYIRFVLPWVAIGAVLFIASFLPYMLFRSRRVREAFRGAA